MNYNSETSYYDKYDLMEYISASPSVASELILILKKAPSTTSDFKFEIKYHQNGIDVGSFSFETDEIEIRKD